MEWTHLEGSRKAAAGDHQKSKQQLIDELRELRTRTAHLESELEQSRRGMERSLADVPIPVLLFAEDGEVLQISRAVTELTGYRPEDIPTIRDWTARAYGAGRDLGKSEVDHLYALRGRIHVGEFVVRTARGDLRTWDFYVFPVGTHPDGRRLVISIANDVTERRVAEEALSQSEARFRIFSELTSDYCFQVWGPMSEPMRHRWFTSSIERITGYSSTEFGQLDLEDWVYPGDLSSVRDRIAVLLSQPGVSEHEFRIVTKGGEVRWVRENLRVSQEADIVTFAGAVQDVTERKRVEDALRESEFHYRNLVEGSPLGIAAFSADGRITAANESLVRLLGAPSASALIGKTAAPVESVSAVEAVRRCLQKGQEVSFELAWRSHWGKQVELRTNVAPARDADGNIIGGQALCEDIIDRKRVDRELASYRNHLEELVEQRTAELLDSREQLRQSERLASVGTLAAGIAHQINDPVGSILIAAESALACEAESDALKRCRLALSDNVEKAERCRKIVRSILQFSRGEPADKWCEDLGEIIRRTSELIDSYASQRAASVRVECTADALPVVMSPIEIEQMLVDLIRNAIESRPEGAGVWVCADRREDWARIRIHDDGKGIPEEQLKRVFDPFFATPLRDGGTGQGLSAAHGIVIEHQGTMAVQSQVAMGTEITIELPLDPERG